MLLKISEVAKQLSVSTRQVRNLINEGKISVIQTGKSCRSDRVEESEVKAFIDRSRKTRSITKPVQRPPYTPRGSLKSMEEELDRLLGKPRVNKKMKTKQQ